MMVVALAMPSVAFARSGEVVQKIPSTAAVESLNRNLSALSRNPDDVDALVGAGNAALKLRDFEAANGFFTRANLVNPSVGAVKLGLAIVELELKQPEQSAADFDAAAALGESARGHLDQRALAYDLTGQQAKAQRDYVAALRVDPTNAKTRLRYAVSLGISGDVEQAQKQLMPMLNAGDREAWRMRAFILAMNGDQHEALKITDSVMPKNLAKALDPYMRRMVLLTPAQKAAAVHLGQFPADMLERKAPSEREAARLAHNDTPPPQERPERKHRTRAAKSRTELADIAGKARALRGPVDPQTEGPVNAPAPPPASASAPTVSAPLEPPPPPKPEPTLAAVMATINVPASARQPTGPVANMAEVARIQAQRREAEAAAAAQAKKAAAEARQKAQAAAKAKAEREHQRELKENPARIWVQIATGKNVKALGFDLRRLRKSYAKAIGDETGYVASWGATHRLLVGPYRSEKTAHAALDKIAKAGGDAFLWESEAGEVVTKIDGE